MQSKYQYQLQDVEEANLYREIYDYSSIPKISFNGCTIEYDNCVKYLGLLLDYKLNFEQHARKVSAKIFGGLRCLWPTSHFLPPNTKKLLVKSLLLPHFAYCTPVLGELSAATKEILSKAFKACVRFIYGLGRYDSTSSHMKLLLGTDLFSYFDYLNCSFSHKLFIVKEPDYILDHFNFGHSARTLNLTLPRNKNNITSTSLFVSGVSKYNALPPHVKKIRSLNNFKIACKNHFVAKGQQH